jgi:hypothetical protein
MQSTRSRLAETIESHRIRLARGLHSWLWADGSVELGSAAVRRLCRAVLRDLRAWLLDGDESARVHARHVLQGDRAAALAGRFLLEFMKCEGLLDALPREERQAVGTLLDTFFRGRLVPGLTKPGGSGARHPWPVPEACDSGRSLPANSIGPAGQDAPPRGDSPQGS